MSELILENKKRIKRDNFITFDFTDNLKIKIIDGQVITKVEIDNQDLLRLKIIIDNAINKLDNNDFQPAY